jgi:SAM-dependent methyltransferase
VKRPYTAFMAGCCPSRDYHRFFNQRFARRIASRYRRRGLDKSAQRMVEFLRGLGIDGATVLEVGGGVGEVEIELLKAGAARAQNLELSPAYEEEARTLAGQAGVQGRIDWRIHDLAQDPGAVAPADLVVLHRVVCCYPDYERLLGAPPTMRAAPWSSAIHPGTCSPARSTGCSTW